jgi:hypothetical protein
MATEPVIDPEKLDTINTTKSKENTITTKNTIVKNNIIKENKPKSASKFTFTNASAIKEISDSNTSTPSLVQSP